MILMATFNLSRLLNEYRNTFSYWSWSSFFGTDSSAWIKRLEFQFKDRTQEVGICELINSLYNLVKEQGPNILPTPEDNTYPAFIAMKQRILDLYDHDVYLQQYNEQFASSLATTFDYLIRVHYLNAYSLLTCDSAIAQMDYTSQLVISRYMETLGRLSTELSSSENQSPINQHFKQDAYQTLKQLESRLESLYDQRKLYQAPEVLKEMNSNKCQLIRQKLAFHSSLRDKVDIISQMLYQHHDLCMIEMVHAELAYQEHNELVGEENLSTINRMLCDDIKEQLIRYGQPRGQAHAWAFAIEKCADVKLTIDLLRSFINRGYLQTVINKEQYLTDILEHAIKTQLTQNSNLNTRQISRFYNIVHYQNSLTLADKIFGELLKASESNYNEAFDQSCALLCHHLTQQTYHIIDASNIANKSRARYYLDIASKLNDYYLSYKLQQHLKSFPMREYELAIAEDDEQRDLRNCHESVWRTLSNKLTSIINARESTRLNPSNEPNNTKRMSYNLGEAIVTAISKKRIRFAISIYQELINDPCKTIASVSEQDKIKQMLQNYIGWGLANKMRLRGQEYKRLRNTLIQLDDFEVLTHFTSYLVNTEARIQWALAHDREVHNYICERNLSRVLCDIIELKLGGSSLYLYAIEQLTKRVFKTQGAFTLGEIDFTRKAFRKLVQERVNLESIFIKLRRRASAYRVIAKHYNDLRKASVFANEVFCDQISYTGNNIPDPVTVSSSFKRDKIEHLLVNLDVKPQIITDFINQLYSQSDETLTTIYYNLFDIATRQPSSSSSDIKDLLNQYHINTGEITPLLDNDPTTNPFDAYSEPVENDFNRISNEECYTDHIDEDPSFESSWKYGRDSKTINLKYFIDQYDQRRDSLPRSQGTRSQFIEKLSLGFYSQQQVPEDELVERLYALFNEGDNPSIPQSGLSGEIFDNIKQAILANYNQDRVLSKYSQDNQFLMDSASCNNYLRRIAYLNILKSLSSESLDDEILLSDLNQLSYVDQLQVGFTDNEPINVRRQSNFSLNASEHFRQHALNVLRTIEGAINDASNKLTHLQNAKDEVINAKLDVIQNQLQSHLGFTVSTTQTIANVLSADRDLFLLQEMTSSLELVKDGDLEEFAVLERLKQIICNKIEKQLLLNNYSSRLANDWSTILFDNTVNLLAQLYLKLNGEGLFKTLKYAQTIRAINQDLIIDKIAEKIPDYDAIRLEFNSLTNILSEERNSLLSETILEQVNKNAAEGLTSRELFAQISRQLVDYFSHELQYLARQLEDNNLLLKYADIVYDQQDYQLAYDVTSLIRQSSRCDPFDDRMNQTHTLINNILEQRLENYFYQRPEFTQHAKLLSFIIQQSGNVILLDRVQKHLNNAEPLAESEYRYLQKLVCHNIAKKLKEQLSFEDSQANYYASFLNQPGKFELAKDLLQLLSPIDLNAPRFSNNILQHFWGLLNAAISEFNNDQPRPNRFSFYEENDADNRLDNNPHMRLST